MRINNNTTPSFTAKFISNAKIGEFKNYKNAYENIKVSFVEVEPESSNDINALENAIKCWEHDKFGINALYAARAARDGSEYYKYHKVYAMTVQKNNF